jgi:hypothetical protein
MRAAVDDIGHRHGQDLGVGAAQVFEQRQSHVRRRRLGIGQRHRQNGIGAQFRFGFRPVQVEHDSIDLQLIERIHLAQGGQNLVGDVFDRFGDAFAAIAGLVGIAQFQGLVFAGAGAGGHRRASGRAAGQENINFDGGIAPRIQNLTSRNVRNSTHSGAHPKSGCTAVKEQAEKARPLRRADSF